MPLCPDYLSPPPNRRPYSCRSWKDCCSDGKCDCVPSGLNKRMCIPMNPGYPYDTDSTDNTYEDFDFINESEGNKGLLILIGILLVILLACFVTGYLKK